MKLGLGPFNHCILRDMCSIFHKTVSGGEICLKDIVSNTSLDLTDVL